MSATGSVAAIVCGSCQRKFAWKPELAGKRVKCKCGQPIAVPAAAGQRSAPAPKAPGTAPAKAQAGPIKRPSAPTVAVAKKPVVAVPSEPGDLDGLLALAEDADRAAASAPIEIRETPLAVAPLPAQQNSRTAIPRRTSARQASASGARRQQQRRRWSTPYAICMYRWVSFLPA